MRATRLLLAVLFSATAAAADPVITSITPATGPASGGWTVIIQGTGFSNNCEDCSPPFKAPDVFFGSTEATSVKFLGPTVLQVVVPPHAVGTVSVTILQELQQETFTLPNAFTYVDDLYEAFDPILFPIFSPPVHGQGGSEFRTTASVWNKGVETATLYGMDWGCAIDPPIDPKVPFRLSPGLGPEQNLFPECSETPGRLFFVPKGDTSLSTSLRVWEVTRQAENHGVEIPVVRRKDFSEDIIALVDVPNDPKFRLTLRIYGLNRGAETVTVFVLGDGHVKDFEQFKLPKNDNPFVPSYIVYTGFPDPASIDDDKLIVMVGIAKGPGDVVPPPTPLWAFITVTNNETQHITTITAN